MCLLVLANVSAINLQDDVLSQALGKNRRLLRYEGGNLTGEGAEFLKEEARLNQFFLVGEDHGQAEIPEFTTALLKTLRGYNYKYLAVETGPITAKMIEPLITRPDGFQAIGNFARAYPYALPFYNWQEEARFLVEAKKSGMHIWGLDQEFIIADRFLFKRLEEIAPNAAARELARSYKEKAAAGYSKMVESKNPTTVFMVTATAEDFQKLEAAFKGPRASEGARIVSELKVSWEIYKKNFANEGYKSNAQRARLMKTHFMDYYKAAQARGDAAPKVLLKFGALHTMKGRTFTNVSDLGTLTTELGEATGTGAFNLAVLGVKGTVNAYRVFNPNEKDRQKDYNLSQSLTFMDVKPLVAIADSNQCTLIDMRALRADLHHGKLGKVDPGLQRFIWGYDAVLLIPQVKGSTYFE
jgi:hypothetical protein